MLNYPEDAWEWQNKPENINNDYMELLLNSLKKQEDNTIHAVLLD